MKDTKINKINNHFTLLHSQISKGIASIVLLYHHLFYSKSSHSNWPNYLIFNGINFRFIIARYFKICTGIYAFLSGIGFYYSLIKIKKLNLMYKKIFNHLVGIFLNFYCILLFAFPIGVKTKILFNCKLNIIINSLTGTHNHGHWWYLRMYLILCIYAPLIIRLFQDIDYKKKIIPWLLFYIIFIYLRYFLKYHNGFYLKILKEYFFFFTKFDVIQIFCVGILCGKLDLINVFITGNKKEEYSLCIFSIITSIFIRCLYVSSDGDMEFDFLCVPLFILPMSHLISKNYFLTNLFCFIGKHSTNIWLIHGYFHNYFFRKILDIFNFDLLLLLWDLILCISCSYLILIIYIPIQNIIHGKGFSYEGYFYFLFQKKNKNSEKKIK